MEQAEQVSESRKLIVQAIKQAEILYGVRIFRINIKRHEETGDLEFVNLTYETKDNV